jgi:hypothetical protein
MASPILLLRNSLDHAGIGYPIHQKILSNLRLRFGVLRGNTVPDLGETLIASGIFECVWTVGDKNRMTGLVSLSAERPRAPASGE